MNVRNGSSRGRRYTEEERAELLRKFRQRQESGREFAARHGMGLSTLQLWMRQRRRTAKRLRAFQEVTLPALGSQWAAEVRLPDGTQLRWNPGADLLTLESMLGQLRRPC